MLVAGALLTAQTGLVLAHTDDDMMSSNESLSSSEPQQVTVFNPDGSSYTMSSGDTLIASSSDSDAIAWDDSSSWSGSEELTVFNPDGSSYAIAPVSVDVAVLEPAIIVAADESMPDQVTVYEPGGLSYSFEMVPVEVALISPMEIDEMYASIEPTSDILAYEDTTFTPLAVIDEDADLRPTYVAHFVSAPEYTGILEENLS
jgi:hypothetical protein